MCVYLYITAASKDPDLLSVRETRFRQWKQAVQRSMNWVHTGPVHGNSSFFMNILISVWCKFDRPEFVCRASLRQRVDAVGRHVHGRDARTVRHRSHLQHVSVKRRCSDFVAESRLVLPHCRRKRIFIEDIQVVNRWKVFFRLCDSSCFVIITSSVQFGLFENYALIFVLEAFSNQTFAHYNT